MYVILRYLLKAKHFILFYVETLLIFSSSFLMCSYCAALSSS